MPKLRYKEHPEEVFEASRLNTSALSEILTGDDSAFFKDLDVFITKGPRANTWQDLREAFRNKDIITDNYNTFILEPRNQEERERGYA